MLKAVKRGKGAYELADDRTSGYEDALDRASSNAMLDRPRAAKFLARVPAVPARDRAAAGSINSLAQVVLKLGSPGVPGLLPGHRALGSQPGRSGQPPAGGLRRAANGCSTRTRATRRGHRGALLLRALAGRHGSSCSSPTAGLRLRRELPHVFVGRRLPAARHGSHRAGATSWPSRERRGDDAVHRDRATPGRAAW